MSRTGGADFQADALIVNGTDRRTVNALDGDDILIGGLGQGDLDGGPGHNHLIW